MKKSKTLTPTLSHIADLAAVYADRHAALVARVTALNDELRAAKRRHLRAIKAAVVGATEAKDRLEQAVREAKGEFEKPRTRTLHGIVVGFRKLVGKLTFGDAAQVVKLIKRHFPHLVKVLIKTEELPVKDALEKLPAADLKRIACEISESSDQLVCKPAEGDVEKIVAALLKGEEESAE